MGHLTSGDPSRVPKSMKTEKAGDLKRKSLLCADRSLITEQDLGDKLEWSLTFSELL
jgi:hypothetical protein